MNNKELLLPIAETDSLIPLSIARNPEFKDTIIFAQSVEKRRERLVKRLEKGFSTNPNREIACIDLINDLTIELATLTGTMRSVHNFRRSIKHSDCE